MANFPTTVNPSYGTSKSSAPTVRIAQFGDGYQQRSTFGINQNLKVYNFTCNIISQTDADEFETFLYERAV